MSASKCRHRVAVALAYKPWHETELEGAPPPSSARVPAQWSPAEIDDSALEKSLGPKRLERARIAMRGGLLVTVERDGVPTAKLPACTVRFLVLPREPGAEKAPTFANGAANVGARANRGLAWPGAIEGNRGE